MNRFPTTKSKSSYSATPSFRRPTGIMLLVALLLTFGLFTSAAQEATPEPTLEPTAEATVEPVLPSETPLPTEVVPPTPEATDIPSEVTPEATEAVTETPIATLPTFADAISEDFEAFTGINWALSGWEVVTSETGSALQTSTGGSIATLLNFAHASLTLDVTLSVATGNTAAININGYTVLFDSVGNNRIYGGENLLAASAVAEVATTESPLPYRLQIRFDNTVITVSVNGVATLTYDTGTAFTTSAVYFATGADNTGTVSIDDLSAIRIEPTVVIAPIETIVPVEVTAEVTPEPIVEATAEATLEATQEATAEATAEATQEAAVIIVPEIAPFLSTNFETELVGWTTTGSIVTDSDTNKALLLSADGTFAPNNPVTLSQFQADFAVKFLDEAGTLNLVVGDARLALSATGITLSQAELQVATSVQAITVSEWHTFSVVVRDGNLSVTQDNSVVLASPLVVTPASMTLGASSTLMLDNVALTDFAPQTIETAPDVMSKLAGSLSDLSNALTGGDTEALNTFLTNYVVTTDEQGRILVEIAVVSIEAIPTISQKIIELGGNVTATTDYMITAFVPLNSLVDIALSTDVVGLRQWIGAASTGPLAAPSEAPSGTVVTEGYNVLGILDWHNAGVLGQNIRIGVIDTGFGTGGAATAPPKSVETICVNAASIFNADAPGALSVSNHGRNVVEVICDIAPSATVYMYQASSYAALYTAINRARVTDSVNVLAITLDLGADQTHGDGLGRGGVNDPYAELALAKQDGVVVLAAAGNGGNPANIANSDKAVRYIAFTGNASLTINISAGDIVRVGTSAGTFSVSGAVSMSGPFGGTYGNFAAFGAGCTTPCSQPLNISSTGGGVVQVQIIPVKTITETAQSNDVRITSSLPAGNIPNAGTLARPADSPDVIAVGAVCADDNRNFIALPDASVGPVYDAGGAASTLPFPAPLTGYVRNQVKPEISGPSLTSTSAFAVGGSTENCDGTIIGSDSAVKFGGSSAATAHMTGVAALILSNSANSSFSRFSRTVEVGTDAVENLEFYLQTHSADLPAANADGFDMQYGAGISIPGTPQYNLNNTINPSLDPEGYLCAGTKIYVGQADVDSTGLGTLSNPYFSIGFALKKALANDCVIVNPGEYSTPIVATGTANNVAVVSYDLASAIDEPNSIIRVAGQYRNPAAGDYFIPAFANPKSFNRNAALYVVNNSTSLSIQGFNFVPATQLKTLNGVSINDLLRDPQGIVVDTSSNVVIANNTFGAVVADGINYTGWTNADATPVLILAGSSNVTVELNNFTFNTSNGSTSVPTISVAGSSALLRRNEFNNNSNISTGTLDFSAIMLFEQSSVDAVGNVFSANTANTVIQSRTPTQDDVSVSTRIVSNVFLYNVGTQIPNTSDPMGGLITLYYNPEIYFIHNTIVKNTFTDQTYGAIILRGVPNTQILDGVPDNATWQRFNVHSNLIYDNTFAGGLAKHTNPIAAGCTKSPSSSAADAVTYNWYTVTAPGSGCVLVNTAIIRNNTTANAPNLSDFAGALSAGTLTQENWRYWGITPDFSSTVTNGEAYSLDKAAPIGTTGLPVDGLNENYDVPFKFDVFGTIRLFDLAGLPNAANNAADVGAFEYTPLQIDDEAGLNAGDDANTRPATFALPPIPEDYGTVTLDVSDYVSGGFGQLRYTIIKSGNFSEAGFDITPQTIRRVRNYGTQCGVQFDGTEGVILGTGVNAGKLYYCPPENFYNLGNGVENNPDAKVEIWYGVVDEANATAIGKIEITITPVNDLPLTDSIGDNIPSGDIVEVTMLANDTVTIPLRPYVSFGNFEWSEESNPEFNDGGFQVDYPFALSNPGKIENVPATPVITGTPTINSNNQIVINSTANRGSAFVTYTVTDDNGNATTNYITVRVTSTIPNEPGLYDDSSIYWNFVNGQPGTINSATYKWSALTNVKAINNTLHQSNGANDRAEFTLNGTGFVIYMQATVRGANYKLQVDGVTTSDWTSAFGLPITSVPPIFEATIDIGTSAEDLKCYARTKAIGTLALPTKSLSNNGSLPYTITCNSQTQQVMNVVLINETTNGTNMTVDAFAILNDAGVGAGGPLAPGRYDMDTQEVRGIFTTKLNWAEHRFAPYNAGIAYRATGAATADDITFSIQGATGFAIGTILQNLGASFDLCVEEGGNDLCHKVDTSPLTVPPVTTPLSYNAYIPWYGLDPLKTYTVSLSNIVIPFTGTTVITYGSLVIDSIVVYSPADKPNGVLPNGTTENDQLQNFVFQGGLEDSWTLNLNNALTSNRSLHTATALNLSGPFLSFDIDDEASDFVYDLYNTNALSRRLMICVDRGVLTAAVGDYANCIVVNTRPLAGEPTYYKVNTADGTLVAQTGIIQAARNSLRIQDLYFDDVNPLPTMRWAGTTKHTVEVFSLVNEANNFDRVTVYTPGVLPPGTHEDFVSAVLFYDSANSIVTPGLFTPTNPLLNYTAATTPTNTFLIHNATYATRDSGGSVIWSKQVGASVVFGVDGTGFAPRFRLDTNSDAVSICYLQQPDQSLPLPAPTIIRNTGTCRIYDNQNSALYQQLRAITGLEDTSGIADNRYYAVAITNLGDQLVPTVHAASPYINMWFDGVVVYNNQWNTLTPIEVGTTVEANFTNRVVLNRFNYLGSTWANTANGGYSAANVDLAKAIGSTVVFRTSNASAIQFRRNLGVGQGLIEMCAALESTPTNKRCVIINNAGTGVGNITTLFLTDTTNTSPHVVTLTQLTPGNFFLDTITAVNASTILTAGKYDDNVAGINYLGRNGANLVLNGNMEADNTLANTYWTPVGTPVSNLRAVPAYQPTYARAVVVNSLSGDGIESLPINFQSGVTYIFTARVYNDGTGGTITMDLIDGVATAAGFTPQTKVFVSPKVWQPVYFVWTAPSNITAKVRFTSDVTALTPAARRFLVDAVGVYERGTSNWETISNTTAFNKSVTRSINPGAEANFAFTGTGFRVGMTLDTFGGAVEICYGVVTPTNCTTFENERSVATNGVSRTFVGLPLNTYQVRIRDVEDGTSVTTLTPLTRPTATQMGRVSVDYVEVFNTSLPPAITSNVSANENYQIGGTLALQLLPTNGWKYQAGATFAKFSGSSNVVIQNTVTSAVSTVLGGHAGVMQLDLSAPSNTVILYSDAPNTTKTDQLLYCVNGYDGVITYNYTLKSYSVEPVPPSVQPPKCKIATLRSSSQAVLSLGTGPTNSVLTFTSLSPAPLLIDGYLVLLGTELSPGYYESSLSEQSSCTSVVPNTSNNCVGTTTVADDEVFEANTQSNWYRQASILFSGGTTLVLEDSGGLAPVVGSPVTGTVSEFKFRINNATGFSLITTLNTLGGTFTVLLDGTNDYTITGTTLSTVALNQVSIPFAGLPLDDYTVTITNVTAKNLYIDAIEVYGDLQNLGSLYDDNQKAVDGTQLIAYGPSLKAWSFVEGAAAATSLNKTYHLTTTAGAVAMFEVGDLVDATGITLLYSKTTSATSVSVCYTNLGTNIRTCSTPFNLVSNPTPGRYSVNFGAAGHYAVSVINGKSERLQFDGIQVQETGGLTEGIYTVQDLRSPSINAFGTVLAPPNTTGNTANWAFLSATNALTATSRAFNAPFTFQMKGIGFSILLNQTAASANNYTICVDRDAGGQDCDTIGTGGTPLALTRLATSNSTFALTYMGLHTAGGADETYTVTLTNTDPLATATARTLVISGLHIMGAKSDYKLDDTNARAENNDVRIRYLPYGWATETINKTGAVSGDSQHLGIRRGGIAYFEYQGAFEDFEYVRQVATTFSDATVCFGQIGITNPLTANTTNCRPIENNGLGAAFGRATFITLTPEVASCAGQGCWVYIKSSEDFKTMPLDFIRWVDATEPMQPGNYEENFSGILNFKPDFTKGVVASSVDTLGMNIKLDQSIVGASGGFVRRFIAAATTTPPTTSALNGGLYFTFQGTGFTARFANDTFQDEIKVCYLAYTGGEPSVTNVLTTGRCQLFDNQSAAVVQKIGRTILGLPSATYAVAIQFLPDNNKPAVHTVATTPLRMDFDSLVIYGDLWFDSNQANWNDNTRTAVITPASGRVETNFNTRTTTRTVQYYGTWSNVANATYSGGNYDTTSIAGSGIVFRTSGANAITIYTALSTVYSELFICASPLNLNPLTETGPIGNRNCIEVPLTGAGLQQPISFRMGNVVDEYVVSITTKRAAAFNLDAIQVFDTTVPLLPGLYEATDTRINYDTTLNNLVVDGEQTQVNSWFTIPLNPLSTTPPSPSTNIIQTTGAVSGTTRRSLATRINSGIESQPFVVASATEYTVAARVFISSGSAQYRLIRGSTTIKVVNFNERLVWSSYQEQIVLTPGTYKIQIVGTGNASNQFVVDGVQVSTGGQWKSEFSTLYSAGSIFRSQVAGSGLTFNFTGTGFEIGTITDRNGGEMELCYGVGTPTNCFVYENESTALSTKVSRVVAGLPYATYVVRIREVDNGYSTLVLSKPTASRPVPVAKIGLDYVRIFDTVNLPTLTPGVYNENATNPSGVPFVGYFPSLRWKSFTGTVAAAYSNSSYSSVVETTGVVSSTFAGPSAVFRINKVAGRPSTLVFNLGPASTTKSLQVLICAGDATTGAITWNGTVFALNTAGTPANCTLRTTMRTVTQFIVNASDLTALSTAASGVTRISISALTPGRLDLDGIQFIQGDALSAGINDDFFAAPPTTSIGVQGTSLLKFAVGNRFGVNPNLTLYNLVGNPSGCNRESEWCLFKSATQYGGTAAFTGANGGTLTFNAEGTGFAVLANLETYGMDMRICYKRAANTTDFPAVLSEEPQSNVKLSLNDESGIYCERRTTSLQAGDWQQENRTWINPLSGSKYGFAFYGLPFGRYTVEVRAINANVDIAASSRLTIDAITVFGNPLANPALGPGLYDNTNAAFSYEPAPLWNSLTFTVAPPSGPYGLTERTTTLAGTIAQVRVTGNAVTFFQTFASNGSRDVQVCLQIQTAGLREGAVHCSETAEAAQTVQMAQWSQFGTGRFSPVMIYGLGAGTHQLIIENRDHNRVLSIDAIMVQP